MFLRDRFLGTSPGHFLRHSSKTNDWTQHGGVLHVTPDTVYGPPLGVRGTKKTEGPIVGQ